MVTSYQNGFHLLDLALMVGSNFRTARYLHRSACVSAISIGLQWRCGPCQRSGHARATIPI